jgi:tetratricopeptide (TPR) repeat protein
MIERDLAEKDLFTCAAYMAERIDSADGHAEALTKITAKLAAKGEVDLAAGLADEIHDPHTRDGCLADIAVRCAEFEDDEYGFQLVEAIEEYGFQQQALTGIAIKQAERGSYEEALNTAEGLDDDSVAKAEIAIRHIRLGEIDAAREILDSIPFPTVKVQVLNEMSAYSLIQEHKARAVELLDESLAEADSIEFAQEKIQSLIDLAWRFSEMGQSEKAFNSLNSALEVSETLETRFRDPVLAQLALGFVRAGNEKLSEKCLKPIDDLQHKADAYMNIALEYFTNGNTEKALETLEESHETLKSQPGREVRSSNARFTLFASIAIRFAQFGKPERGLEIANNNPDEGPRLSALSQIAAICTARGEELQSKQALNSIDDNGVKVFALIGMSDAAQKANLREKSVQFLDAAYHLTEEVAQLPSRSQALNEIALRCIEHHQTDKAKTILHENLEIISTILDDTQRTLAVSNISEVYENAGFEVNEAETKIIQEMLKRKMY